MGFYSCEDCNEELDEKDVNSYKRLRLEIQIQKWKHVVYCMECYEDIGDDRMLRGSVDITIIRQVQKDDTEYKLYHLTELNRVNIRDVISIIKKDHQVAVVYDVNQSSLCFESPWHKYRELIAHKPVCSSTESWEYIPAWANVEKH